MKLGGRLDVGEMEGCWGGHGLEAASRNTWRAEETAGDLITADSC